MKKRLAALTAAVLTTVMMLTGCQQGGASTDGQSPTIQRTHGSDEAVMYLGPLAEPEMGFDPTLGWANVDGVSIFHSNLVHLDQDMKIQPDLATSWELASDGITYSFTLHPEARFSDGSPITGNDVKFTYEKSIERGYVGGIDTIESIEAPDDHTVVMRLKDPNSLFIYAVARLGIIPESGYSDDYGSKPVGSGPYRLIQWDKGQQLIAEVNEHYFGQPPSLKKLTVLFLSEETALEFAKSGKLDLYSTPIIFSGEQVPNMRTLELSSADRLHISLPNTAPGETTREDGLPVGNAVTSDLAIRKALNVGINRQEIVQGVLGNHGRPAFELVSEDMLWWNPETAFTDSDTEKAQQILAEAGWQDTNGDGIVEKDSVPAEFDLLAAADNKTYQALAMVVAQQAKKFGININVSAKSWDEIDKLMYANPFVLLWGSRDPINVEFLYHSTKAGMGYHNTSYYSNETVDQHIEAYS